MKLYVHVFLLTHLATAEKVVIIFTRGVRTSQNTKRSRNANVGVRKIKYALRRTPCVQIVTTIWLWPGGSSQTR